MSGRIERARQLETPWRRHGVFPKARRSIEEKVA